MFSTESILVSVFIVQVTGLKEDCKLGFLLNFALKKRNGCKRLLNTPAEVDPGVQLQHKYAQCQVCSKLVQIEMAVKLGVLVKRDGINNYVFTEHCWPNTSIKCGRGVGKKAMTRN